jgi:[acyl-carrier-protein] S-malonyltransferase
MAPAAKVMEEALRSVDMKAPVVPLVANVVAGPISDPAEIRRRLVEQVTSMVRWRESIAWLAGAGVNLFAEVGAGKVLSGLAKRIADGAETLTVGAPDDIDAAMARLV